MHPPRPSWSYYYGALSNSLLISHSFVTSSPACVSWPGATRVKRGASWCSRPVMTRTPARWALWALLCPPIYELHWAFFVGLRVSRKSYWETSSCKLGVVPPEEQGRGLWTHRDSCRYAAGHVLSDHISRSFQILDTVFKGACTFLGTRAVGCRR